MRKNNLKYKKKYQKKIKKKCFLDFFIFTKKLTKTNKYKKF